MGEELYAQPNGQKTSTAEDDEHRDDPDNAPTKKNMKVKNKDKQRRKKDVCFIARVLLLIHCPIDSYEVGHAFYVYHGC